MVVIELQWYLKLHVQSVPITTNVGSSNRAHVVAYSIQRYVIKFVSDLLHVEGLFSLISFKNKTGYHDISEILLKVALNTITLTVTQSKLS